MTTNSKIAIVIETKGIPGLNRIAIQTLENTAAAAANNDEDHPYDDTSSSSMDYVNRQSVSLIPPSDITHSQIQLLRSLLATPPPKPTPTTNTSQK